MKQDNCNTTTGTTVALEQHSFHPAVLVNFTSIIEALEAFQSFEPTVRVAAITLYASELGIAQLHFYAIALYAGLGGAQW